MNYTTDILILSDLHLGSRHADTARLLKSIAEIKPKRLVLLGDIVDIFKKNRGHWKWGSEEDSVIQWITNLNAEVVFIVGNHDESYIPPFNCEICTETYYTTPNGDKYLLLHGHLFDAEYLKNNPMLYKIGDFLYDMVLDISSAFSLDKFKIPAIIKSRVKYITNFVNTYQKDLAKYAVEKSCMGIVSGHIHWPEASYVTAPGLNHPLIHYLNSGSWIRGEHSSYVIEVNGSLVLKVTGE